MSSGHDKETDNKDISTERYWQSCSNNVLYLKNNGVFLTIQAWKPSLVDLKNKIKTYK